MATRRRKFSPDELLAYKKRLEENFLVLSIKDASSELGTILEAIQSGQEKASALHLVACVAALELHCKSLCYFVFDEYGHQIDYRKSSFGDISFDPAQVMGAQGQYFSLGDLMALHVRVNSFDDYVQFVNDLMNLKKGQKRFNIVQQVLKRGSGLKWGKPKPERVSLLKKMFFLRHQIVHEGYFGKSFENSEPIMDYIRSAVWVIDSVNFHIERAYHPEIYMHAYNDAAQYRVEARMKVVDFWHEKLKRDAFGDEAKAMLDEAHKHWRDYVFSFADAMSMQAAGSGVHSHRIAVVGECCESRIRDIRFWVEDPGSIEYGQLGRLRRLLKRIWRLVER